MVSQKTSTIVFLSTYPPRECGIATFTQDLLHSSQLFLGSDVKCKVAALNLTPLDTYKYPEEVEWQIDQNNKKSYALFAKIVNTDRHITGVIIQHEYGIFGGEEGEHLLEFMNVCKKPMLVTLHTVLPSPSQKMHDITAQIIKRALKIVVLTQHSKDIVNKIYPHSGSKVFVIPHGIHPVSFSVSKEPKHHLELRKHTVLTTFGLLSRGKGLEYAINALPPVIKKHPSVMYLILGETHPVIMRQEGESYRIMLQQLITRLKLEKHVKFYDQYLSLPDLFDLLKATDIYISTSINPNQAVSGTLSYAMGSGRAVISTDFPQARELVTPDTGRLVPTQDSEALTKAILDLLSNPKRLKEMHQNAYMTTRPMLWSNVAEKYVNLLDKNIVPPVNLKHLYRMTDSFGLFQFAHMSIPDKAYGYTLDDNARALIFCSWMIKSNAKEDLVPLAHIYLSFIKTCQRKNGSFINYIGYDQTQTSQNKVEDLQDAQARAMQSLSEVISNKLLPQQMRDEAKRMFILAYSHKSKHNHLRSKALMIKSLALVCNELPEEKDEIIRDIHIYADALIQSLSQHSIKTWRWFEDNLTYNNALLSENLIIAGNITQNPSYTDKGMESLQFLIGKTFSSDMYIPIGHSQWYTNTKKRSEYDQQPEDPASMIVALDTAYKSSHNEEYKNLARKCFSWFLGHNSLGIPLYDPLTGGCYDGLHVDRVNLNQGAESLISYLMASFITRELN